MVTKLSTKRRGNIVVEDILNPKATIRQIVPNIKESADCEYLIVIGGTNDIEKGQSKALSEVMEHLIFSANHNKILLTL